MIDGVQCDRQGLDDGRRDFVLDRKHVIETSIVALRPDGTLGGRVDQLDVEPDAIPKAANTALQDMLDTQFLGYLADGFGRVDVCERRVAGDDEKTGYLGKIGDDVVGDTLGKIVLCLVVRHVAEGQNRDRRAVGQRGRGAVDRHRLRFGRTRGYRQHPELFCQDERHQGRDGCEGGPTPAPQTDADRDDHAHRAVAADAIDAHRSVDVFEVLQPRIHIFRIDTSFDLSERIFGKANTAGFRQTFDPGRNIYPIAKDVIGLNDHIADIESDPELDPLVTRDHGIPSPHARLNGNCTPHRIDDTRELGQQTITGGLHDPPLVVRDTWLD